MQATHLRLHPDKADPHRASPLFWQDDLRHAHNLWRGLSSRTTPHARGQVPGVPISEGLGERTAELRWPGALISNNDLAVEYFD
jgi:hypothetical protein